MVNIRATTMITLKDLTLLIDHLHHANEVFDAEALLEERKNKETHYASELDKRKGYASRSVILHQKANQVINLEKKLLEECACTAITVQENIIYTARELIAESMYPWINRKEPLSKDIDELMSDKTFIPFASGLTATQKRLLCCPLTTLCLPEYLESKLSVVITKVTNNKKNVTPTLGDIFSFGISNLHTHLEENATYKLHLITFRLYVLGLLQEN